jgi:transposase InsO family protein
VVRRLQGRVPAGQPAVLLSANYHRSREPYLLTCEALGTTQETFAFTVFERAFRDFGLPQRIRTDNGVPFASAHALYRLSKLAVWWLRLGIQIERIQPGHPRSRTAAGRSRDSTARTMLGNVSAIACRTSPGVISITGP